MGQAADAACRALRWCVVAPHGCGDMHPFIVAARLLRPQTYAEAIRIAQERESQMLVVFTRCTVEVHGRMDMGEMLCALDDLNVLAKLRSDPVDFASRMFREHDASNGGTLECEPCPNPAP